MDIVNVVSWQLLKDYCYEYLSFCFSSLFPEIIFWLFFISFTQWHSSASWNNIFLLHATLKIQWGWLIPCMSNRLHWLQPREAFTIVCMFQPRRS